MKQPASKKAVSRKPAVAAKGKGKGVGSPDSMIAYAAVGLVMFAASAALAWFYLRKPAPPAPPSAYTKIGPVNFRVKDQSARVTLDLQQPRDTDMNWAKQNYGALETVIESVLTDTEPAVMNAPNDVKFAQMQSRLTAALKKNFPQAKIDKVFVTDYVSAAD